MSSSDRQRWPLGLLVVILIAHVVVTGLLIRQNRELKARLEATQTTDTADVPRLEVGDVVDAFTLPALDGTPTRLDFSSPDSETLLLFFSPDCPACNSNFPNWQAIEQAKRNEERRVVFISTVPEERTRLYLADKGLDSEVLIGDPDVLDRYKVFRIPTTVQVRPDGVVSGVWTGVLPDTVVSTL